MTKRKMLSLNDVEKRLAKIRSVASDCEVAHTLEDELFWLVLKAIAKGETLDPPSMLATCTLKSRMIKFPRYHA